MEYYIGCDAHKEYSVFVVVDGNGRAGPADRVAHDRETYRKYLGLLPPCSPIALESVGNWYWMVDEMERAGHKPLLTNAGKAKLMMGHVNKTDKLDSKGLAVLNRNGTLPTVWIPPGELRDQRELSRMRMALVGVRTKFKNRIHATLAKYAITLDDASDIFGKKGRQLLARSVTELPEETRRSVEGHLRLLDQVSEQILEVEEHIRQIVAATPAIRLLKTLPGVGDILAITIALEIGDVNRFPDGVHLCSYAGTVPRVKSSGGKTYYGKTRTDVNHYLKWAFIEAANSISLHQRQLEGRHVVDLMKRIGQQKGHAKAMGAVARHLAEAAYAVLKKNEPYHEPGGQNTISSNQGKREHAHET
jgi:transposase